MVMGQCMTASGQGECNIKLLKGTTVKEEGKVEGGWGGGLSIILYYGLEMPSFQTCVIIVKWSSCMQMLSFRS